MNIITLYRLVRDDIKVTVEARFNNEVLVIEGYDIGKTVEEYWGDLDYEYTTTIPAEEVPKLFDILHVEPGNKDALLQALAERYNTNSCYSDIRKLLDDHGIRCEGFSWT